MFAVLVTPAISNHLRGYLTRFLTEVQPNTFLGNASSAVVERLWERVTAVELQGNLTLITNSSSSEQGFVIRTAGSQAPTVLEVDGLQLVARKKVANGNIRS